MRPFVVCFHDATPAHARETRVMMRDLARLVGRRVAMGVVPDWHGAWPLAAHRDYCRLVQDSAEELLLHGYHHRRRRGRGPISLLAGQSDEMNGLDRGETRVVIERGQRVFTDVFGAPARGFLAPAWQRGHVAPHAGVQHVLGFFSLDAADGTRIPLATWTWDCGRWRWLGHAGHGVGRLLHAMNRGVPVVAIHPADLRMGFWPKILRLIRELLGTGHEPATAARLLRDSC